MRKSLKLAFFMTVALAAGGARADMLPAPTASYDADVAADIGDDHTTSTLNAAGPRERLVLNLPSGKQTLFIERDTGKAYLLMPAINSAMTIDPKTMGGYNLAALSTIPVKADGTETIAGVPATRYEVQARDKHGQFDGHIWASAEGAIMKVEGNATSGGNVTPVSIVLSNFHQRPQSPALVALPPGIKVMPFGLAGLMGSQSPYPAPITKAK